MKTAINELKIRKPYVGQRFTWKGKTGQIIGVVKKILNTKVFMIKPGLWLLLKILRGSTFLWFGLRLNNTRQSVADVNQVW